MVIRMSTRISSNSRVSMSGHQIEECPECETYDMGLRWVGGKFIFVCRRCDHEITEDSA